MKIQMTIKAIPDSREETLTTFPKEFQEFKGMMEMTNEQAGFGLPSSKVDLRFVVDGGKTV